MSGRFAFWAWLAASTVIMLDSLLSYFARAWTGSGLQVNAILPLLIFPALLATPRDRLLPPIGPLIALVMGYGGFVVGVFTFGDATLGRMESITSGFAAYIVGYATVMQLDEQRSQTWQRLLTGIGIVYVAVCSVALLRLAPSLLPTIDAIRMRDGALILRPEVTTDQNFQVFYLLPCVIPLVATMRRWTMIAIAANVAALGVLSQLQTRSGAIVFAFAIVLGIFAAVRRSKHKTLLIAIGAAVGFAAFLLTIRSLTEVAAPLVDRFTRDDMSTFQGRLWSAAYLAQHVLTPSWWIPQGNEAFRQLANGEVPHFNGTAFFLEGGLLGLICWIAVHIVPTVRASFLFLMGRLSATGEAIVVVAASTLLASMTLNVPYVELVWMWAGAALAVRMNPELHAATAARSVVEQRESGQAVAPAPPQFGNLMR